MAGDREYVTALLLIRERERPADKIVSVLDSESLEVAGQRASILRATRPDVVREAFDVAAHL
jgi:hypothetical protein